MSCSIWADNVFSLVVTSVQTLPPHITDLARTFWRAGLRLSPESLQTLHNPHCVARPLRLEPEGPLSQTDSRLVCLGVALDAAGSTETQVHYRVD